MITELYAPFLLTATLIELTPGPNMAWLALTSASHGRRSGCAAVAGIALGLSVLAVVTAAGLAELAMRSVFVFGLLRYAGVAYLLWLAWKAWVGDNELSVNIAGQDALGAWFRDGLLLNIFNPKAAVFFITVLPVYISSEYRIAPQTALLSASYVAIATVVHLFVVALAGKAHRWLGAGNETFIIRRVFAASLAAVAVWFMIISA